MSQFAGVTSVLIPLYNHAAFLTQALDSLLVSDCSKIELVISDDASSDESYKIASAWLAKNGAGFASCKLWSNPSNLGITENMNKLAAAANGEFITFLASDDMLTERAIDAQKDFLLSNPGVDFVFADCAIMDRHRNIIKPHVISHPLSLLLKLPGMLMVNAIFNWNIVWARLFARRARFGEFGSYIQEHSIEDRWSALKILNSGRYGYMHKVVHVYRYRGIAEHPAINGAEARKDFHDIERRLHGETSGMLYCLLWVRRLPFKTNFGKWPARLNE